MSHSFIFHFILQKHDMWMIKRSADKNSRNQFLMDQFGPAGVASSQSKPGFCRVHIRLFSLDFCSPQDSYLGSCRAERLLLTRVSSLCLGRKDRGGPGPAGPPPDPGELPLLGQEGLRRSRSCRVLRPALLLEEGSRTSF